MWITEKMLDAIVLSQADALSERNKSAILEQQLAVQQSQFEWLSHLVNRLETERAAILQRVTGVAVPVPNIIPSARAPRGPRPESRRSTTGSRSLTNHRSGRRVVTTKSTRVTKHTKQTKSDS